MTCRFLALTFHSKRYDHLTLRRLAAQIDDAVKQVPLVAETNIIGGERREVRVLLDPGRLVSRNLSPAGIVPMLQQANRQFAAGGLTSDNHEIVVETGAFLKNAEEVGNVVVGVFSGKPVYLRDVAEIVDGAEEPSQYVLFGSGAAKSALADEQPAVTLTVAKRPGANAIDVAERVLKKVDTLKGTLIPADVQISITRQLWRNGLGEIQRIAVPHAACGARRLAADSVDARLARIGDCLDRDPFHARSHLAGLLSLRLHAQPDHAFRADLFHRHPGRRRDRGR